MLCANAINGRRSHDQAGQSILASVNVGSLSVDNIEGIITELGSLIGNVKTNIVARFGDGLFAVKAIEESQYCALH
jgi:hypothetical protein